MIDSKKKQRPAPLVKRWIERETNIPTDPCILSSGVMRKRRDVIE